MSKTGIQVKNMKKVFTTNWYLQKIYFSHSISEKKGDSIYKTKHQTDV
jgi:hypothetical protein